MELAIAVPPEREESAVAAAASCGTLGAWCERPGLVRAYFGARTAPEALSHAFRVAWRGVAPDTPPPALEVRAVPPSDWLASFRLSARPIRSGARLWIAPPEAEPPTGGYPEDAIVVLIRPGQGFGTGTHATTRALLRWLEAEPGFDDALDVGTGSGILALAALALGARRAVALEIDPVAIENAAENRALNRAWDLTLVRGAFDAVRPGLGFDRVLANLDGATIESLLPGLARHVAPGGRLGVAGLLVGEQDRIVDLAGEAGMRLLDTSIEADPATHDRWWGGWFAAASSRAR